MRPFFSNLTQIGGAKLQKYLQPPVGILLAGKTVLEHRISILRSFRYKIIIYGLVQYFLKTS